MNNPTVDQYMRNENTLNKWEVRHLQDEHNMGLQGDEPDEFMDNDDSDLEGLEIIDEAEFFDRFCE